MTTPAPDQPASPDTLSAPERQRRLRELRQLFLQLGAVAFGGPAAHIALMQEEVVERRRWLDRQTFMDLLGATNLIPGPNSTELAIHIGYARAGWRGLITAGVCFTLPAMLIVWTLAAIYTRYQVLPEVTWLLYGVKPVILAIVAQALFKMGGTVIKNAPTALLGAGVITASFLGIHEILLLLLAGLAMMLLRNWRRGVGASVLLLPSSGLSTLGTVTATTLAGGPTFVKVFWFFLKIGSVLYGSGYVLLAFLHQDLVERWHWLSHTQLLDAVAVGQVTPGPVFTTATFIGYLLAGHPGAVAATIGIFLPAFVLVAAVNPWVPKLRRSPWAQGFLDGVNIASLALMAVVTWQLSRATLVDWLTMGLLLGSLIGLIRFRLNSTWLIAGGALVGGLLALL